MTEHRARFAVTWRGAFGRNGPRCALGGAVAAMLLAAASPAAAEDGIRLADAAAANSETMATGDQLLLTGRDGPLRFAGRDLTLSGFSGILGYASETAYVLVIDGEMSEGSRRIGPGRMLLIPPYGAPSDVQRFDAARLRDRWGDQARAAQPAIYERLDTLAGRQASGLFFGRLGRTSSNVTAPRGPERELAGRTLLGNPSIRAIRFDGQAGAAAVERRIVDAFRAALMSGDAPAAAALMDPMPFGGRALGGGAREARLLAARALIASGDWPSLLGSGEPEQADGRWRLGRITLTLHRVDDFAFIQHIEGVTQ